MIMVLLETFEISVFGAICLAMGGFMVGIVLELICNFWALFFDLITYKLFPRSLKKEYWIHAKDFQIYMQNARLWDILHDKDFKRMRLVKKILKK
ncbi:hypothetical protein [Anaerotignum propionicum]|uniref:hypothetical protein n=1 Tax=Anaerotignum propionicum TaxID=28446 RepID=UPI0028A24B9E|nr:hypothetical protein [Anaerotignum propionicum]